MDIDGQARLFRLAVEAIAISAIYEPGRGWRLHVNARRQGEEWSESRLCAYECLTTPELVDVLSADLAAALGL
jgi:hypothetical protein